MLAPPLIALLTDFGHLDPYVGIVKGVLLSRCPGASLVDLTHGVPAQDVLAGALHLAAAAPYFPLGTVFLVVVDPGVGGERRPLCLRSGGRQFVGPDNGLLWPAASFFGTPEAFHLDRRELWLPRQSATFHGRDLFAPVAAALAGGQPAEDTGTPIENPVRLEFPQPVALDDRIKGEVLHVDTYGNAITNLTPAVCGHPQPESVEFHVGGERVRGPSSHYAAVPVGAPVVVLGSLGYYEVALRDGSAAGSLGLRRGAPVVLHTGARL